MNGEGESVLVSLSQEILTTCYDQSFRVPCISMQVQEFAEMRGGFAVKIKSYLL
jgi:hypothetical protein